MKKIVISIFLGLVCVAFSSDAMKRELSSARESVAKKVRFADPVKVKKYTCKKLDQIVQKAIKADNKKEDALYPQRFYYVRGVSRKLANKYCGVMCRLQHGFGNAFGDCKDYEEEHFHDGKAELFKQNMEHIRPFLVRYTKTVIKKAMSLRSADLKDDEIGDECAQAIETIESNAKLLSYILTGRRKDETTQEQWHDKWKQILAMSLMHQEIAVAL